jgi:hypothetical protein
MTKKEPLQLTAMQDYKQRILKAVREKCQALRVNNCQTRLPYLAKFSFKSDGEINNFQDEHKVK